MDKQIRRISKFDNERLHEYFNTEPLKGLHALKLYTDDVYYNTGKDSGLKDHQYDMLKDALSIRDPGYVVPIGARIRESENRVELPYWLGSMDKKTVKDPRTIFWKEQEELLAEDHDDIDELHAVIDEIWVQLSADEKEKYTNQAEKDLEKDLNNWLSKNKSDEYLIEYKLDGVSCLLVMNKGKIKLYTRGDGIVGADISYLAQYFDSIPKNTNLTTVVRGELIMKQGVFEQKYAKEYKNPRNMVAGRLGGKTVRKGLSDIDFVAYEIVGKGKIPKPSDQLGGLKKAGFTVVHNKIMKKPTVSSLSKMLLNFKSTSPYEIDGIIVHINKEYIRNTSGNPNYAFAFKLRSIDNIKITTVEEVKWELSKWGVFKPRVKINPLKLGGVTIDYATGHNARYIVANKIGPGAKIKVTRSGDVIPYIVEVVKPTHAQMPEDDYVWNETKVDIYTTQNNSIMCIKLIAGFFDKLNIKHVSEATVTKMHENGLDTLLKIIAADKNRLMQIQTIKEKSATRIYTNIRKGLQNISIPEVLGSSGIFGFGMGRKRIVTLMTQVPDLLELGRTLSTEELKDKIVNVEGFSVKTADKVVQNVLWASKFIDELSEYATFKKSKNKGSSMQGMKFVFSGFRDSKIEEEIISRKGKVTTSVSSNTTGVITTDKNSNTGKPKKAREKGIPVYDKQEFLNLYNLN